MLWQLRSCIRSSTISSRSMLAVCLLGNLTVYAAAQDTPPASPPATPAQTAPVPRTGAPPQTDAVPVVVRSVQVTGNTVIKTEDISKAVLAVTGKTPADRKIVQDAVNAALTLYRRHGYVMAQVMEAETTPDGVLHLTMAEGVIRRVMIRGNTRTRRHTILQVLTVRPGTVYNDAQIRRDRMRLGRLGIFADISIAPQVPGAPDETTTDKTGPDTAKPGTTPQDTKDSKNAPPATPLAEPPVAPEDALGKIDIVVRVRDEPTVNIAATVGYTDAVGAVGFLDLSENNLLGTGHRVEIQWQRTAQTTINADGQLQTTDSRSAAGFSYEVPPLGTRSLAFGAEVYNQNTVFVPYFAGGKDTIRTYERRSGARGRIGKLFTDNFEAYATIRRDIVGYDPVPDDLNPPIDRLATAAGTVGALGFDLIADGRDAVDTPQRGYRHELQFERAGNWLGGNRIFNQTTLDLREYLPLRSPARPEATGSKRQIVPILATRLMGGYSSGDVPLSEKFFLGGYELLRGYDLYSIWGDRFYLGTAEMRLPLGSGLQGVVFTDFGNAWDAGQSTSLHDIKSSLGIGLRFLSPIGPIRLDAAYGSHLQTYISFGQSF